MNKKIIVIENMPKKCPICGKEILIKNDYSDYACIDINCILGKGFLKSLENINEKWYNTKK